MDILKKKIDNLHLSRALSNFTSRNVVVGSVDDDKIFTNEEIKQQFIESITQQDTFRSIKSSIIHLIETDKVIPVHVQPGILNRMIFELYKNKKRFAQSNFSMAFFDFKSKKIYVLVENIDNIQYWKKEESLSLILLHELQHMSSNSYPADFMRIHKDALTNYYRTFINSYFEIKVTDEDAFKLPMWLHHNMEQHTTSSSEVLFKQYFSVLWDLVRPHKSPEETQKYMKEYFDAVNTYLKNPSAYLQMLHSKDDKVYPLYSSLKEAYDSLNVFNIDSICIQECFFPSEVICIESEYNTQPRHFKLITKIK